jgi:tRNA/tmRNA/rRNA uracil-C5-methylase (TrmA/RlmC/RlmD family)
VENEVVRERSPERVEPACRYFPACGGCDFMHVGYAAEIKYKGEIVSSTLRRIVGRDVPVAPFPEGTTEFNPLAYRNTVTLHAGDGCIGYFRKETNDLVAVDECPLAVQPVSDAIGRLRRRGIPAGLRSLSIRAGNVRGNDRCYPLLTTFIYPRTVRHKGRAVVFEVAGREFTVGHDSFFQVNVPVAERIIAVLKTVLPSGGRLIDLFAGVGLFTVSLSERYERVTGFEKVPSALRDARRNCLGMKGVRVVKWDAMRGVPPGVGDGDMIVLDPPRTGLPKILCKQLGAMNPRAVAYISCDPATLARDLSAFFRSGYALTSPVRVFDMFPRTAHVESLAIMKKEGS